MEKVQWIGLGIVGVLFIIFGIRGIIKRLKKKPVVEEGPNAVVELSWPTNLKAGGAADVAFYLSVPKGKLLKEFQLDTKFPLGNGFPMAPLQELFDITTISDPENLTIKGTSRLRDTAGNVVGVRGPMIARKILDVPLALVGSGVSRVSMPEDGAGETPMEGYLSDGEAPLLWGKDIQLPPLKKSDILRGDVYDFLGSPSWKGFLRMADIATIAGLEAALKAGYEKGLSNTRRFVDDNVKDEPRRSMMLGDLNEMSRIFQQRVKATFGEMVSVTDLGKILDPPPGEDPRWFLRGDGKELLIDTLDPKVEVDSHYRFFEHPKVKIKLGNLNEAMNDKDPNKLFFKAIGFKMDIWEEKAELKAPDPERPHEELQKIIWMRSKLSLELGVDNLLKDRAMEDKINSGQMSASEAEPRIFGNLNYIFQNRPGEATYIFGVQGSTTPGWKNSEFSINFGLSWGSNPEVLP